MSDASETIDSGFFGEAREVGLVIAELLHAGRRTSDLDRHAIVYLVGPDGRVFHHARLIRERLTDGSPVFNNVLS